MVVNFKNYTGFRGVCFARNGDPEPRADIKSAMNIIGTELSFDTFSADFLIDKNTYWCIDVNPAPALFKSGNAREHLVNHIFSADKPRSESFADIYKKSIAKRGGLKPFILRKMKRSAGTFIKRLVRTMPQNARIIEIGAGTGAISALLAQRGFRMTAIDRDPRMLPMIQDSFTALGVTGDTRVANAFAFKKDFSSERFACAVSHGVMEHYSDTKIIDLLRAQLAVAERVVFIVPMSCMSTKYRNNGIGDERYLTTSEWLSILECGHFKVTSVYGFGSKETSGLHIPEILWRWGVSARLLAPFAAFNEYWIEDRK